MKKTLVFSVVAALFVTVAITLGYNSQVEKVDALYSPANEYDSLAINVRSFDSLALSVKILNPDFINNFNGLVVFPELGSQSELKGLFAVSRGPPKS